MNPKRIRKLNDKDMDSGPVIYWMSRDQRVRDNWALVFAQDMALEKNSELIIVFCLAPQFLGATLRQYGFMLKGLKQLQEELDKKNIPFILLTGAPETEIISLIQKYSAGLLVTDFSPLRIKKEWIHQILRKISIAFYEVDAHNIVPCWIASEKKEYGAYTLRPKLKMMLPEFLDEFPGVKRNKIKRFEQPEIDWEAAFETLEIDRSVNEVEWIQPGEKNARFIMKNFVDNKLDDYTAFRNDPNSDALSNLSPYLHFGHISSQRVALEVSASSASEEAKKAFLEELIVRKELSDNFCYYNGDYDSVRGFPEWAQKTLRSHASDQREYLYTLNEFENASTHDELWNAAQMEMVKTGKMHGYLRMYWAKKILEWTRTPEEAFDVAIYLNDRYELDGRDPNGYTGIAWSIGGVHDRAWGSRGVFGKIRYMSYRGSASKFNINKYIERINAL